MLLMLQQILAFYSKRMLKKFSCLETLKVTCTRKIMGLRGGSFLFTHKLQTKIIYICLDNR